MRDARDPSHQYALESVILCLDRANTRRCSSYVPYPSLIHDPDAPCLIFLTRYSASKDTGRLDTRALLCPSRHTGVFIPHMLTQITAISTPVPTPRALVRFLLGVYAFMRVMLRLCCACVVAKAAFVLALACVGRLVVLQLLFGAERAATGFTAGWICVAADVGVVLAVCA
jgi:hypothetical protein